MEGVSKLTNACRASVDRILDELLDGRLKIENDLP